MNAAWGELDRLVARADALAGAWGGRARASTTIGQERAILRLFGVTGLDSVGRPLAGATIDRWLAGDPRALAAGIALPFAMALLEYDLEPQQLALDIASGAIDLALESELLREPDRRLVAEAEASRLASVAVERIDAQRTVRRETIGMLGEAERPWLAVTLQEPDVDAALQEAATLIAAGVDLIRIEVPIGRELADRMFDAGLEVPAWHPHASGRAPGLDLPEPAPTGSQRAISRLRRAVDRAAAERRAYVRLEIAAPTLGAPEGAVVAAFERIDLLASDSMSEIVADAVEPDRSLADHAFAHRLARRAGTAILVGPGPLVVAPDLSAGVPSGPTTRAGRALALQLLGVTMARGDGLPVDQVIVCALPPWSSDEPAPGARAIAEVAVRRALFPGHPFGFMEPPTGAARSVLWPFMQAAAAVHAGDIAFVLRTLTSAPGDAQATAHAARAASLISADVARGTSPRVLSGIALDHAREMIVAAIATLDDLADYGWRTVAEDPRPPSAAHDDATERTEAFDPFESTLGPRS